MFITTFNYNCFTLYWAVALDGNKTEDRRLQWLKKKRAGTPATAV
jgi:hypothetical protein